MLSLYSALYVLSFSKFLKWYIISSKKLKIKNDEKNIGFTLLCIEAKDIFGSCNCCMYVYFNILSYYIELH